MPLQLAEVEPASAASTINRTFSNDVSDTEAERHARNLDQGRPMAPARGIVIAMLISIPFWTLCAFVAYLLT